jgi:hypothetical protein
VDLSESRALFETLATRFELFTSITDATIDAITANFTPWIINLEEEVEALSNKLPTSYEDLL